MNDQLLDYELSRKAIRYICSVAYHNKWPFNETCDVVEAVTSLRFTIND